MTKNSQAQTPRPAAAETTSDRIEERLVAFAEQLGTLVGTVHAKAEGWLDRRNLAEEIRRIRDGASELLAQVSPGDASRPKTAAPATAAESAPRRSRGLVDAPGKRHRKPVPQERIDKHMGDPIGKQMGQKTAKNARRSGRG